MFNWIRSNRAVLLVSAAMGAALGVGTITALLHGLEYPAWALLIIVVGVISGISKSSHRPFLLGWAAGFTATLAVGVVQSAFAELYFKNNPVYLESAESLPISPVLFTLLMMPLLGALFGTFSGLTALLMSRVSGRSR